LNLLNNSDAGEECFISYSPEVEHALVTLRAFSRDWIYNNPKLTSEREKIKTMYRILFSKYLEDLESDRRDSKIVAEFTSSPWVNQDYLHSTSPAGLVRDFIAGMTDRYFLKRFEECVLPRRVERSFR
ncbi:MAG: phosphohydrolase, partial [Methanoregula sp.]